MKIINLTFVLVQISLTLSVKQSRHYDPRENEIRNYPSIWYKGINGNLHYEDFKIRDAKVGTQRASSTNVNLYLFTRKNAKTGIKLLMEDVDKLAQICEYDRNKTNFFIIHGWTHNNKSAVNTLITAAVLDTEDVNVFVVDWGSLANNGYYISRYAVPKVGQYLGDFINDMIATYQLSSKSFKIVGHSLGAHVAGIAGSTVARKNGLVDYIVGMDPAKPLFTLSDKDGRIDETDGNFVEIIHTSTNMLGFLSALGHVDHYPNGGSAQPGCGVDVSGFCAHLRSFELYAESLRSNAGFVSTQCNSWEDFKKQKCTNNSKTHLGGFNVEEAEIGDYYLKTNCKSPFAMS